MNEFIDFIVTFTRLSINFFLKSRILNTNCITMLTAVEEQSKKKKELCGQGQTCYV